MLEEKRVIAKPRYTPEELRALTKLVQQCRWILQADDRIPPTVRRQAWTEIARCMHANGWPKRSWLQLRLKGEKIFTCQSLCNRPRAESRLNSEHPLRSDVENEHSSPSSTEVNHLNPTASAQAVPIGSAPQYFIPVPQNLPRTPGPNIRTHSINGETPNRTIPVRASSFTPQILCVSSRATQPTSTPCLLDHSGVTTNKPVPSGAKIHSPSCSAVSTPFCQSVQLKELNAEQARSIDRIDLCASSDEDDGFVSDTTVPNTTTPNASSTTQSQRLDPNTMASTQGRSLPMSDLVASPAEQETKARMDIYQLKIDVLQMKQNYWAAKLEALSRLMKSAASN
ncbi:unnamed protein product [Calicophoron daubneyi]|uniref:Myb/SANT-like DNA-binding domain-containing protein n=1 Tax=Calicophoron daubneyi TaxID=300641 RepID=A0AAV2TPF9_CALDB